MTGWAAAVLRCPAMVRDVRLPWFVGFPCVLWGISLAGRVDPDGPVLEWAIGVAYALPAGLTPA